MAFLCEAIERLRTAYRDRDSTLLLASGEPESVIPALATSLDAEVVTWGADYSGLAQERDAAVGAALDASGVEALPVHQAVHHRPGSITTNAGDPYKVFTHYAKKWHDRPKASPVDPPADELLADLPRDAREHESFESGDGDASLLTEVPTLEDLGFDDPEATIPAAGTATARERLEKFCEEDIYRYADRRDHPAERCTSRLSPHLTFGTLGIRT
jgi:deoxyribodipyrimidine photo-lyase